MTTDWSEWGPLTERTADEAPESPAVYQVSLNREGGIRRLLDDDPDGVLYIGESKRLSRRLAGFLHGMTRGRGHSGSNIVHQMGQDRKELFCEGIAKEQYRYRYVETPLSARHKIEKAELKAYLNRFGELPPFNAALPGGKGKRADTR